jgi:hypothetical protein
MLISIVMKKKKRRRRRRRRNNVSVPRHRRRAAAAAAAENQTMCHQHVVRYWRICLKVASFAHCAMDERPRDALFVWIDCKFVSATKKKKHECKESSALVVSM